MNIFVLDNDPAKAAQYQCDKHVVKMVLETGQILSTVHWYYGNDDDRLYAPTHKKHPCVLWAVKSKSNYNWLVKHFISLCNEYKNRYGKEHLTYAKLKDVVKRPPKPQKDKGLTPFALAMPDEYKSDCPVKSYRTYYRLGKAHLLTYNHSKRPEWL